MIFHYREGRAVRASAPGGLTLRACNQHFINSSPSRTQEFTAALEITFATTLSQHSLILQRKNQTRPGAQLKTSKNFKIMTYVSNIFNSSLNSNRKLKYFSVEVITFDGESFIEEVEARSAEEAQEIAASGYENVDYTMVQGCFAGW